MKQIFKTILLTALMLVMSGCTAEHTEVPAAEESTPVPAETAAPEAAEKKEEVREEEKPAKLLYIGHASLRIVTPEDKVIYIDPFAPGDYSRAADLVLVTHDHYDHTATDLIENKADDYTLITQKEALRAGEHQSFDFGYVNVKAVEAGNNPNHDITKCVGYVLTLRSGIRIYVSGDTSTVSGMADLKNDAIDYAFFCCDGVYNMDAAEAGECAKLVNAKHSIPYHVIPPEGVYFSREKAEAFESDTRMILEPGEEIELES